VAQHSWCQSRTEKHLEETGFDLCNHHVVALANDVDNIRTALLELARKDRPKISFDHKLEEHVAASSHVGDADAHEDLHDDTVDVFVEHMYVAGTDSNIGYPVYSSAP